MSDYKILDKKINRDRFSNRIKKNYNSSIDHYKTQSNFVINDLKKYYQLNSENKKVSDHNKTLKSQLEFNNFLSNIKKDDNRLRKITEVV